MNNGKRMLALMMALVLCGVTFLGCAVSEGEVTADFTEVPTEAPTEVPTEAPTEAPTDEPTDAPTEAPTPAPHDAPTPTPTPEPHDESICDHLSDPLCEHASLCQTPGCAHIGYDSFGLDIPLCPLGEWYLTAFDEPALGEVGGIRLMARKSAPTTIDVGQGSATIWRSGVYALTGTGSGSVTVMDNRVVSLTISGLTSSGTLTLKGGAVANLSAEGQNSLGGITGGKLHYLGAGSLAVGSFGGSLGRVSGGSLLLPGALTASGGKTMLAFPATGATCCTVDGADYPLSAIHTDGNAYLWLAPPQSGSYRASVTGGVLTVVSGPDAPHPGSTLTVDQDHDLTLSGAYTLTGTGNGGSATVTVNAADITLTLNGLTAAHPADLAVNHEATAHFDGADEHLRTVSGSATLHLQGAGSLTIESLQSPVTAQGSGNIQIKAISGAPLAALCELPVGGTLTAKTRATLDGAAIALLWCGQSAYLPTPPAGMGYAAMLDGDKLTIISQLSGIQNLPLADTELTITQNGVYRLQGQKGVETLGKITLAAGLPSVRLILDEVHLSAEALLTIGDGAIVTLEAPAGVSAATLYGGISLGADAVLTVLGEGALTISALTPVNTTDHKASVSVQCNLTGIDTLIDLKEYDRVATVIVVTDESGAVVSDRPVTLKLGDGSPFERKTDAQGRVAVWDRQRVTGVAVAVLSDAAVTAAILGDTPTQPDAPAKPVTPVKTPSITDISAKNNIIVFKTDNAGTAGVVYKVGADTQPIRDGFDPSCAFVPMIGGECEIPALEKGQVVSYRCVAAYEGGAALTEETQDAFAFSEQSAFTAIKSQQRRGLTLKSDDLKKEYDDCEFAFDTAKVPSRLTVEYLREGSWTKRAPVKVGSYPVRIFVPMQDATFYPGQYDFTVRIQKRVVYVFPGDYEKMQGESDPEGFDYSYEPSLLPGDQITGRLTREAGEESGNYPYSLSRLSAPEYYELRLAEDAAMFFISERPHSWIDPMDRIDPVHQVLQFSSGKKLDLILNTTEKLLLGVEEYGSMVIDGIDGKMRPFSPSLRLMPRHDNALLILRAEAELSPDHGYETDRDGRVIYRPRTLLLTLDKIKRLQRQSISHILFELNGTGVMLALSDLRAQAMQDTLHDQQALLTQGRFCVSLEPITGQDDLLPGEESAETAARLSLPLMRVGVSFQTATNQVIDVTGALSELTVAFAQDELSLPEEEGQASADIVKTRDGRIVTAPAAETTNEYEQRFELALHRMAREGTVMCRYGALPASLDTLLIVPYTSSEEEALYRSLMQGATYLMTRVQSGGLYGVSNTQWLAQ